MMNSFNLSPALASDQDFLVFLENAIDSAKNELDIEFDVVEFSLYGSVAKGNPAANDIDVFAEIELFADIGAAYELGFEFDEVEFESDEDLDEQFQANRFLADHIHAFLHGELAGFKQPHFNGIPVDICVKLMSCEDYLEKDDFFITMSAE